MPIRQYSKPRLAATGAAALLALMAAAGSVQAASPGVSTADPAAVAEWRKAAAAQLAERMPALQADVIKLDQDVFAAIQNKNVDKLEEALDIEALVTDSTRSGGAVDKSTFIDRVKAGPKPPAKKIVGQTFKGIISYEHDVAVINGFIQGENEAQPSAAYSAIYVELLGQWQLSRYHVSPLTPFEVRATKVSKPWSKEDLSVSQSRSLLALNNFLEGTARKDEALLTKTLGKSFYSIVGQGPDAVHRSKDDYIAAVKAGPAAAPATVENPEIGFVGNYGDLTGVTGIIRAADGKESYFTAAVRQDGIFSENWLVEHFHSSPVRP